MGVQFLLRKYAFFNPFRLALCDLMGFGGDTLILSTGYARKAILNPYNGDMFINSIKKGFPHNAETKIIVVGGMLIDPKEEAKFRSFLTELNKTFNRLTFYRVIGDNWHGKIAVKAHNKKPIAAIVGSSNLTSPAFGIPQILNNSNQLNSSYNNKEADIYFWDGNHPSIKGKSYVGINEGELNLSMTEKYRKTCVDKLTEELTNLNKANNKDEIKKFLSYPIDISKIKCKIVDVYYPLIEEKHKDIKIEEKRKKEENQNKAYLINYVYNIFLCDKLIRYFKASDINPIKSIINAKISHNDVSSILNDIYEDLMGFIDICTYEEKIF